MAEEDFLDGGTWRAQLADDLVHAQAVAREAFGTGLPNDHRMLVWGMACAFQEIRDERRRREEAR